MSIDLAHVRAAYDREQRREHVFDSAAYTFSWDELPGGRRVRRVHGPSARAEDNVVLFTDLDAASADEAVRRQIAYFGAHGHAFEWKLHDHDLPADLDTRLRAGGFVASAVETLVVRDLREPYQAGDLPVGVRVEQLDDPARFDLVERASVAAFGNADHARWIAGTLRDEKALVPEELLVHVALAGDEPVAAGWVRLPTGRQFASLWGGGTHPDWRGRGIYGALVARRVADARRAGHRWLTVDCSAESLPILERRGFTPLARITPWIWTPGGALDPASTGG